ncbi:S-adenosyl-L-methionine-dependent methyltransferase [Haematococcus lacustris]
MPLLQASVRLTCWNRDVYEPSDDTFLLTDALEAAVQQWPALEPGSRPRMVLELGCGSGYVTCSLALMVRQLGLALSLLAVDHSRAALDATHQTLHNHQVQGVDLIQGDLLSSLQHRSPASLDMVIFNPPYVPTPDAEVQSRGLSSAWAGGFKGRRVIDRFMPQLSRVLRCGGQLLLVAVAENDPQDLIATMQATGHYTGAVVRSKQADEETLSIVQLTKL